jgi:hypothetical protein
MRPRVQTAQPRPLQSRDQLFPLRLLVTLALLIWVGVEVRRALLIIASRLLA